MISKNTTQIPQHNGITPTQCIHKRSEWSRAGTVQRQSSK